MVSVTGLAEQPGPVRDLTTANDKKGRKASAGRAKGATRARAQLIPLSAPPIGELPLWGHRVAFDAFFVELVPPGRRVFNVRLPATFCSISFGPAEGTSSLAGDRLRKYDRRPYEFIVVPPHFPLSGETDDAPEVLVFVIEFARIREPLAGAFGVPADTLESEVLIEAGNPFVVELTQRIRRLLNEDQPAKSYLESLCFTLLVEMFRPIVERRNQRPRQQVDKTKIDMLLSFIDANLDGDLGIDRLAQSIGVTDHQLSRQFKKVVGESPHKYVLQRRTDAARRLVINEDYPLAEIAFATGFSSQSHMTTAFKNVLGTTPAAIRRDR